MADGKQGRISKDCFVQIYPVSILTNRTDTSSQRICQATANKTLLLLQQLCIRCVIFSGPLSPACLLQPFPYLCSPTPTWCFGGSEAWFCNKISVKQNGWCIPWLGFVFSRNPDCPTIVHHIPLLVQLSVASPSTLSSRASPAAFWYQQFWSHAESWS